MEDPMTNNPTTDHPGMMGDGTEEQNLNQTGNPSARITEDEVQAAFGGANGAPANGAAKAKAKATQAVKTVAAEARTFASKAKDKADDYYDEASEAVDDGVSVLTARVNAVRDQVQQSAEAARDWAMRQAEAAKQTAQDKPMMVISASAGVALAVGLMAGFVIGRATADEY
jgi:ElaB/YqjD/DUF883 family membrane-anchored ribosome-binding protein